MTCYKNSSARIAPAPTLLPADIQDAIDAIMRGNEPLVLFTTMARDRRLFFKFFNSGLLDRGHLSIRQREIVIDRVTARCGADYEWGVHIAAYAAKAGLSDRQITSLATGSACDEGWSDEDRVLIRLCDSLHDSCTVDDDLWDDLTRYHCDEAIIELLMLAGLYRMVSYLVNALQLPLEPNTTGLPQAPPLTQPAAEAPNSAAAQGMTTRWTSRVARACATLMRSWTADNHRRDPADVQPQPMLVRYKEHG